MERALPHMEEDVLPRAIIVTEQIGLGFGGISAPEMTQEQAELEAHEVSKFRVSIDWTNPVVCIDGRTVVLEEGQDSLPLGAHMAGAVETALVATKAVDYHLQGAELLVSLGDKGFNFGAHVDSGNKAQNFEFGTGCGACDKCDGNCGLFKDNKDALGPTVSTLMGEDFNQQVYEKVSISAVSDDNNHAKDLVGEDRTETLLDDSEGVHGHRE